MKTRLRIVTGLALLAALLPGCRTRGTKTTAPAAAPPAAAPAAGAGTAAAPANPAGMDLRRKIDEAVVYNQLRQIALFYSSYNKDMGRPPATQQDLAEYLKRDAAKEYNSLQQGLLVVVPNARPASGVVVAYEREPDRAGNQFVAFGDGAVQKMTAPQLQAALQPR